MSRFVPFNMTGVPPDLGPWLGNTEGDPNVGDWVRGKVHIHCMMYIQVGLMKKWFCSTN